MGVQNRIGKICGIQLLLGVCQDHSEKEQGEEDPYEAGGKDS